MQSPAQEEEVEDERDSNVTVGEQILSGSSEKVTGKPRAVGQFMHHFRRALAH